MTLFSSPYTDYVTQGCLVLFMEVYLYFQGLYLIMCVTVLFFLMGLAYRKARCGSRACIVVLGDIGRSPRMQYHALSLAAQNFDVEMVGYGGSKPHEDLMRNDKIKLHIMSNPPDVPTAFPGLFRYAFKVIWQSMQLYWVILVRLQWPSHILVQNPPAIPTLAVAWVCSRLYGSKFMIDWHNYGYTVLGLSLGKDHLLVRFAKWFEGVFARWGDGHLCVTNAMKDDLMKNWGLKRPITLYDRPPKVFKETPLESQHELFLRLSADYPVFASSDELRNTTAFTEMTSSGEIVRKDDRPVLIISSTSWTKDEDFSVLLSALEIYEKACQDGNLPRLVCAITGKGQQKKYYQDIIEQMTFKHVQLCTPWLTAEDYPLLLGSSDLGVCLHTSSSGLDLPMKVVDMFGSGLPVCAIKFNCISELVKHDENGLVFSNADELATQLQVSYLLGGPDNSILAGSFSKASRKILLGLKRRALLTLSNYIFQDLLQGFPKEQKRLEIFRANLKPFQAERWEENWVKTVRPTLYV